MLVVLSLCIGLYPLKYFFIDRKFGLLSSKSAEILNNNLWNIALYATGGLISKVGFFTLGIIWLFTTILGFKALKQGDITKHKKFMIYSYAACFGAVTLRIYLPILISLCGGFTTAYKIIAWLSWGPNIIVAFFIVKKIELDGVDFQ